MKNGKKQILFLHIGMNVGGIEKALLSALSVIDNRRFDVTLLVEHEGGALWNDIPVWVHKGEIPFRDEYLYRRSHGWLNTVVWACQTGRLLLAMRLLWQKAVWRLWHKRRGVLYEEVEGRWIAELVDVSRLPAEVDFAFAYVANMMFASLVDLWYPHSISAIWFHDGSNRLLTRGYRRVVRRFKHRFTVSQSMATKLNDLYSRRDIKFEVMPHVVNAGFYEKMAESGDGFTDDYTGMRILTVARLNRAKGIDIAIECARMLKCSGCQFRWYIIGAGMDAEDYPQMVERAGVTDVFFLMGKKENPYRFIKECDIYVQPSRWEAYGLAVAEARAFARPIIATDFCGAREQLEEEETGLIVPVEDSVALSNAVRRLIDNRKLRDRLHKNLCATGVSDGMNARAAWKALLEEGD